MSFTSFEHFKFDSRLYKGISQAGYEVPTPIQAVAIPSVLDGDDMVGTAQTGTGKTAAFVLPILNKLLDGSRNKSQALIITPTRELAEQIHETICALGTATGIRSTTIYGGVGAGPQIKALRDGVEILVACPGRLLDHINQKHAQLDTIKTLVLDEADRMFDMGFLPSVEEIINHLPDRRQTLLFSATFPPEIEKLTVKTLKNPKRIAVGISRPAYTVQHALYPVTQNLKTSLLKLILRQTPTESVLIFTRTKYRAKRLTIQIKHMGYKVTSIHGNRTQSQRQTALNGFKEGKHHIMVATDVAARGLDVESITHVINFDMPDTVEAYIHRIGRTGRAQRKGDAFTLVTPEDNDKIKTLERAMGQKLARQFLENFDYDFKTNRIPQSQSKDGYRKRISNKERASNQYKFAHPDALHKNNKAKRKLKAEDDDSNLKIKKFERLEQNGHRKTRKNIHGKDLKYRGGRSRVNQEDHWQKRLNNKTQAGEAKPGRQNQETKDKRVKAKKKNVEMQGSFHISKRQKTNVGIQDDKPKRRKSKKAHRKASNKWKNK